MAIAIPPDAECCMIPRKWLPVLQSIARGPFIPIDFPLPIVISSLVPDDEIWFARTIDDDIEIIKKEKVNDQMFKAIGPGSPDSPDDQLCERQLQASSRSNQPD